MEGRRPSGSVKGGDHHGNLCIVSVPPAVRPESAQKCFASAGINGGRVDVREDRASSNLDRILILF